MTPDEVKAVNGDEACPFCGNAMMWTAHCRPCQFTSDYRPHGPRASAVMAAVEEAMGVQCGNCMHHDSCDEPDISMACALGGVRAAWRTP